MTVLRDAIVVVLVLSAMGAAQDDGASATGLEGLLGPDVVWARDIQSDVQTLCSEPFGGRAGAALPVVRDWLENRMRGCGLLPVGGRYRQPFALSGRRGVNLYGLLPATDRGPDSVPAPGYLVLGAHYDHLGKPGGRLHPGAADNAAGVAALLSVARQLGLRNRDRAILFVFFDLEEAGLLGSEAFVRAPPLPLDDCRWALSCDILGRPALGLLDDWLFVQGWEWTPGILADLETLRTKTPQRLGLFRTEIAGDRSDFVAFRNRGVPHLFFTTGEFEGYHGPEDLASTLDYPALLAQARFLTTCASHLASRRDRESFADVAASQLVEYADLEALARGIAQLPADRVPAERARQALALAARARLVLDRGEVHDDDRAWLMSVGRDLGRRLR
ncbi:MAG: M28 family peptidase [Planctomycetes bacterium]|nr:M28 family peptidase [Planctomycetota bacterium]